jgi:hypothetical protein
LAARRAGHGSIQFQLRHRENSFVETGGLKERHRPGDTPLTKDISRPVKTHFLD